MSIHIRTYLCVWVNFVTVEDFGHYFLQWHFPSDCNVSFFQYILEMKYDNEPILFYVGKDSGMDLMVRAPIFFDILVTLYHNTDSVMRHHNLLSFMAIFVVLFIRPFYEMNHSVLHFCLLYQTYAISGCNRSVLGP